MDMYLDESGRVIDDPAFTPPPGAILYRTRRGTFVFPVPGTILTLTAEDPPQKRITTPAGISPNRGNRHTKWSKP